MKTLLRNILIPALVLCARTGFTQNWDTLGSGINSSVSSVRTLYGDSVTQKLYVGGYFYTAGGLTVNNVAQWNGTSWDSLGSGLHPADQAWAFERYNNKLFVGGNFRSIGLDFRYRSLATWDGSQWDSLPGILPFPNQAIIWCLKEYNNELYVGGSFASIGSLNNLPSIVKWNGTNWINLNLPIIFDSTFMVVNAIEFYQGKMFVAGNFSIATSTDTMKDIFMWDGANVSQVGIGFEGNMTAISSLAVYNGELYIGGVFTTADGNAGNNICKWDGTILTDVAGGLSSPPYELKVINNELYAVGTFSYAGGVYAHQIAKWNGQQWCGLGSTFNNGAESLGFFNNDIYIGGGFTTIDGDTLRHIAKWIGGNYTDTCSVPVGISDVRNEIGITIYPNPVSENLTVGISNHSSEKSYLYIHNVLGEKVYKSEITSNKIEINVSHLQNGMYFIELREKKNMLRTKFIKN